MPNKTRECIHCRTTLKLTATECGTCKSTDPFGGKKELRRFKICLVFISLSLLVVLLFLDYKYPGQINWRVRRSW